MKVTTEQRRIRKRAIKMQNTLGSKLPMKEAIRRLKNEISNDVSQQKDR